VGPRLGNARPRGLTDPGTPRLAGRRQGYLEAHSLTLALDPSAASTTSSTEGDVDARHSYSCGSGGTNPITRSSRIAASATSVGATFKMALSGRSR